MSRRGSMMSRRFSRSVPTDIAGEIFPEPPLDEEVVESLDLARADAQEAQAANEEKEKESLDDEEIEEKEKSKPEGDGSESEEEGEEEKSSEDQKETEKKEAEQDDKILSELPESDGIMPYWVNGGQYEKQRLSVPVNEDYIPLIFRGDPPFDYEEFQKRVDPSNAITSLQALLQRPQVGPQIVQITVANFAPSQNQLKHISKALSACPKLEVLALVKMMISDISQFFFPRLRFCDLSHNKITKMKQVAQFLDNSPRIDTLHLTGNDVCRLERDFFAIVIARPNFLRVLNNKTITINDRFKSYAKYGSKERKRAMGFDIWDASICARPNILEMLPDKWNPENLTELTLAGAGLTEIHVAAFKNLDKLKLPFNKLDGPGLYNSGITRLPKLRLIDLSYNAISSMSAISHLPYVPSLLVLDLRGNPLFAKRKHEFRLRIIFLTRILKGTDEGNGLHVFDGKVVSVREKLQALKTFGESKEVQRDEWRMLLINQYGHLKVKQMEEKKQAIHVDRMEFVDMGLSAVELGDYTALEVLSLRNNKLTTVKGLEKLTNLRVLDLKGNPKLDWAKTLDQIKTFTKLEFVSLMTRGEAMQNKKYRALAIASLLDTNSALVLMDEMTVTYSMRIEACSKAKGINEVALLTYKFELAACMNATKQAGRRYLPQDVKMAHQGTEGTDTGGLRQYDPAVVTVMGRMHKIGLRSEFSDFSRFTALKKLNISSNKISKLCNLGLENCKMLDTLDVRFNDLQDQVPAVASLIDDNWHHLAILLIGPGNSNFSKKKLIGELSCLANSECPFSCLDEAISLDERVTAYKRLNSSASDGEVNLFRCRTVVNMRKPAGVEPKDAKALDLSDGELKEVDITEFVSLESLSLEHNAIKRLSAVRGLNRLTNLAVLKLANNQLDSLDDIIKFVNDHDRIEAITIASNPSSSKDARKKIIGSIKRLREVSERGRRFRNIDNTPISIDEIIVQWPSGPSAGKLPPDKFRFDVALFDRNLSDPKDCDATSELDLSICGLTWLNLTDFHSLQTLNLSKNRLTTRQINLDNFRHIVTLKVLDLSYNRIDSLLALAELTDLLRVHTLSIAHNPPVVNDRKARLKFLSLCKQTRHAGSPLSNLDGRPVTIQEKSDAMTLVTSAGDVAVENLRCELTLEEMGMLNTDEVEELDLSKKGLRSIAPLAEIRDTGYHKLRVLILTENRLTTLTGQGLKGLKALEMLDISMNSLPSTEHIVSELRFCLSLRELRMKKSCGKDMAGPRDYADFIGRSLRGIERIDNINNPHKLAEEGELAVQTLQVMTEGIITRNNVVDIDLSNCGLSESMLGDFIIYLSPLPVERLNLEGNTLQRATNYRPLFIFNVPSLLVLDAQDVSDEERANAVKLVGSQRYKMLFRARKKRIMANFDMRRAEKLLTQRKSEMSKGGNTGGSTAAGNADGAKDAAAAAGGAAAGAVDTVKDGAAAVLGQVKPVVMPAIHFTGTLLTKSEIIIHFMQVYALVITLIPRVNWPEIVFEWTVWFNIVFDIDFIIPDLAFDAWYLKFGVMNALPILLTLFYWIPLKRENWNKRFVMRFWRTMFFTFLVWIVFLAIAAGITALIYMEQLGNVKGQFPTPEMLGTFIIFASIPTFFVLFYIVLGVSFYTHRNSQTFWYSLDRIRKRVCLFFITVTYMPLAKTNLSTFQCTGKQLSLFPTLPCVTSFDTGGGLNFDNMREFHWMAIIFAPIYIVGIPIFFTLLIQRGVKMVEMNSNFHFDRTELSDIRKMIKAEKDKVRKKKLKVMLKLKRKSLSARYAQAVNEFQVASAYLYSAYEYKHRFNKIIQMMEKFLLLILSTFELFDSVKDFIGDGVIAAIGVYAVIMRPFSDQTEDLMDIFSRWTSALTLGFGILLRIGWLDKAVGEVLIMIVTFGTLGGTTLTILSQPFRACRAASKMKKAAGDGVTAFQDMDLDHEMTSLDLVGKAKDAGAGVSDAAKDVAEKVKEVTPGGVPELKSPNTDLPGTVDDDGPIESNPGKAARDMAHDMKEKGQAVAGAAGEAAREVAHGMKGSPRSSPRSPARLV